MIAKNNFNKIIIILFYLSFVDGYEMINCILWCWFGSLEFNSVVFSRSYIWFYSVSILMS